MACRMKIQVATANAFADHVTTTDRFLEEEWHELCQGGAP